MRAIISCVHANEEALRAVLADIARHPVDRVYCLGDTLGYGPGPVECLELVMPMSVVLLGNHDAGVIGDADGFGAYAARAVDYHRRRLAEYDLAAGRAVDFLHGLPRSHAEGDELYVHGSPRDPMNDMIFPEDIYSERRMRVVSSLMPRLCFCGHTHVPGVFIESEAGQRQFLAPDEIGGECVFDGRKTIVNVGSVGQPRDGDWQACYVLYDDSTVRFRRVEYDVDVTVRKIYDCPHLNAMNGDRLREGR